MRISERNQAKARKRLFQQRVQKASLRILKCNYIFVLVLSFLRKDQQSSWAELDTRNCHSTFASLQLHGESLNYLWNHRPVSQRPALWLVFSLTWQNLRSFLVWSPSLSASNRILSVLRTDSCHKSAVLHFFVFPKRFWVSIEHPGVLLRYSCLGDSARSLLFP